MSNEKVSKITSGITNRVVAILNTLSIDDQTASLNSAEISERVIKASGYDLSVAETNAVMKRVSSICSQLCRRHAIRRTSKRTNDGKFGYYLHTKPFVPADTLESRVQHADAIEQTQYEKLSAPAKIKTLLNHLNLTQLTELLSVVSLRINDTMNTHISEVAELKSRITEQQTQIQEYHERILPLVNLIDSQTR